MSQDVDGRQAEAAPGEWEAPERLPEDGDEDVLVLELDGFEGPLDLLLVLARSQKVDLTKLSDSPARRAISRLHRGRPRAAP